MSTKNWRTKLNLARDLKKRGIQLLFERMTVLAQVHDDPEFRAWCAAENRDLYNELDHDVDDTAATFMTLKAVLDHFPNREDWQTKGLPTMIAEIQVKQRAERKPRETVSHKQRADDAEKLVEQLQDEVDRLRAENSLLREQVAELKESLAFAHRTLSNDLRTRGTTPCKNAG
jgi:hypothetical protein